MKYDEMIELLERLERDGKYFRLTRNYDHKAAIGIQGALGKWVDIQKGVRERCVLSPDLFKTHARCRSGVNELITLDSQMIER